MSRPTLGDLGERRIIAELLAPRYAHGGGRFGDDCASLSLTDIPHGHLVMTTDPCPPPMAAQLGFNDPYYRGWLLATINLSDLAAAGAEPLGLLTSLQLPASTTIADFERLLDGIDAVSTTGPASSVATSKRRPKSTSGHQPSASAIRRRSHAPAPASGMRSSHWESSDPSGQVSSASSAVCSPAMRPRRYCTTC